jgi:hypothetical protein
MVGGSSLRKGSPALNKTTKQYESLLRRTHVLETIERSSDITVRQWQSQR